MQTRFLVYNYSISFIKDDQSRGGLIGGGGSPAVVAEGRDKKADPGGGGWNPSILSDTTLPLQDQVSYIVFERVFRNEAPLWTCNPENNENVHI